MSGALRDDGRPATPSRTHTPGEAVSNWLVVGFFCVGLLVAGWAVENPSASAQPDNKGKKAEFRAGAVRYVKDVDKAVEFYTKHLGFKVELAAPAFGAVSNGSLTLRLSGPKSSGSRAMPDGRKQEPGGWNRIVLEVDDLSAHVEAMRKAVSAFGTRSRKARAASKSNWKIPTATRWSCSSRPSSRATEPALDYRLPGPGLPLPSPNHKARRNQIGKGGHPGRSSSVVSECVLWSARFRSRLLGTSYSQPP